MSMNNKLTVNKELLWGVISGYILNHLEVKEEYKFKQKELDEKILKFVTNIFEEIKLDKYFFKQAKIYISKNFFEKFFVNNEKKNNLVRKIEEEFNIFFDKLEETSLKLTSQELFYFLLGVSEEVA